MSARADVGADTGVSDFMSRHPALQIDAAVTAGLKLGLHFGAAEDRAGSRRISLR
jgi:hypothetical protein